MFDTRNDLPVSTRTPVIELLNARLADAIDFGTQAKHAHWNVKGPHFSALHELFDQIAASFAEQIDSLAERATALGGRARGTLAQVAHATSLQTYPEELSEGRAHVDALSRALADYAAKVRAAIGRADELGDADTADLFTGLSRESDKYLWFLEAHLHAQR
jgi:starvation-inducible DNA-binding protein